MLLLLTCRATHSIQGHTMSHFFVWPKPVKAMYVFPIMDLASKRVSKLLINGITISKTSVKRNLIQKLLNDHIRDFRCL